MAPLAASSITITLASPAHDKLVLALAAQAWPESERAGHWHALNTLLQNGRGDDVLLPAAWRGDQLLAAVVGQVMTGRTALVWPPQFAHVNTPHHQNVSAALLDRLHGELAARGVHLAQALLSSDDGAATGRLQHGGFLHAANLLYLAASAESFPDHPLALPFDFEPFQPGDEQRLIKLIDRTYEGTLDCPRIDNLRETADVVTGYQAVGEFRPELWQTARCGDEDIGCLLINLHPDAGNAEIVYVGLVAGARGRGWGLEMTRYAQWLARNSGYERVVLAVDAANHPAIRMYAAAGFAEFDTKEVWVRSLR
jgi:ribosomal protein S18 acetylase RimI-like enzyme